MTAWYPWRKPLPPDPIDTEEAKRMLATAKGREARTKRLTRQTQHAISQNNFAVNIKRAMEA